jgi:septal ring factor EnvC (AmiA/AmiB activator)
MPDEAAIADMKRNVYALLESINRNGVDFFEVWNAAKEMGGANSANIRSAYTSLRFADKTLSKESLIRSGRDYVQALQRVIETESAKRLQEKNSLEKQREETRKRLDQEINRIEEEINALQRKLAGLQVERQGIDADFDPRIGMIESKIRSGRRAVDEVLADMQAVIGIMERDIN